MRLLLVTNLGTDYLKHFLASRPHITSARYAEALQEIHRDFYSWSDSWSQALAPYGYEVDYIYPNVEWLLRSWTRDHEPQAKNDLTADEIVVQMAKTFRPDILWYMAHDPAMLKQLKGLPGVRLTLGWTGSAIVTPEVLRSVNLVLSCAPETVDLLRQQGAKAEHLHHSFDPRILNSCGELHKRDGIVFSGQLLPMEGYHPRRTRLIESVLDAGLPLEVYAPGLDRYFEHDGLTLRCLKRSLIWARSRLETAGISPKDLGSIPVTRSTYFWEKAPQFSPLGDAARKGLLHPPVYGMDMFRLLCSSLICLNVHADSSPTHASNRRLWEATGCGGCLVTEAHSNISELFEPCQEVVTYSSADECVEKLKWLIENPNVARTIGDAGQIRTLKDHTHEQRAPKLAALVREHL